MTGTASPESVLSASECTYLSYFLGGILLYSIHVTCESFVDHILQYYYTCTCTVHVWLVNKEAQFPTFTCGSWGGGGQPLEGV